MLTPKKPRWVAKDHERLHEWGVFQAFFFSDTVTYPLGNDHKLLPWEVWKIIDFKHTVGWDILVPRRVPPQITTSKNSLKVT